MGATTNLNYEGDFEFALTGRQRDAAPWDREEIRGANRAPSPPNCLGGFYFPERALLRSAVSARIAVFLTLLRVKPSRSEISAPERPSQYRR